MDKKNLRKELFQKRSEVTDKAQKSDIIADSALQLLRFRGAQSVFCYVSMGNEVITHALIRRLCAMGIKVYVPYTRAPHPMRLSFLTDTADLSVDKHGNLLSLTHETFYDGIVDAVLVPMLGFNKQLYRIGYGGGYYDRYFSGNDVFKIGLAFSEQLTFFNPEPHDIALDCVLTQNGTVYPT